MSVHPAFQKTSVIERAYAHAAHAPHAVVPLRDRSIGALLVDAGRLSVEDADRVLRVQQERGVRFGDAGIALGVLSDDDVRFALDRQYEHAVLPLGDASVAPEVIAAFQPGHRTVEALRQLRTQLQLRWLDASDGRQSLAIVSAEPGVGKSYVAANLAILFAQLGGRTLLVDADLRDPQQHHLFRLDNTVGLATVLTDRAGLERASAVEAFARLSVLPAGPPSPNPQELLSRTPFARLLQAARDHYDVVLVDTPAWSAGADAQVVSARAGAAVVVARPGHTPARALDRVVASLKECGTPLVGSVFNQI